MVLVRPQIVLYFSESMHQQTKFIADFSPLKDCILPLECSEYRHFQAISLISPNHDLVFREAPASWRTGMTFCIKCGTELDPDHMEFCPNCGAPLGGSKHSGAPIKQNSKQGENRKRGIKEWLSHPLVLLLQVQ